MADHLRAKRLDEFELPVEVGAVELDDPPGAFNRRPVVRRRIVEENVADVMHRTHHHVRRELVDGALHRLGVARTRLGLEADVDVDFPRPFRLQAPRLGEVAAKALADRPQPDALVLWNRQRVRRRHVLRQAHPREASVDVRLHHVRQRIHGMGAELPAVPAVNRNQLHRHTHMMPFPGTVADSPD